MSSKNKELTEAREHLQGLVEEAESRCASLEVELANAQEEGEKLEHDLELVKEGSADTQEELGEAIKRIKQINKQLGAYRGHHKTRKDKVIVSTMILSSLFVHASLFSIACP